MFDFLSGDNPLTRLGAVWNDINGTTQQQQFAHDEAAIARAENSAEAKRARDWSEYMSNTAIQRQVADMKAAGINPASLNGNGADVPSAPMASASPASAPGSGGSGGFLGLAAGMAKTALSIALFKKFSHSANMSATAAGAVAKVGQELSETRKVYNRAGALKGSTEIFRRTRDVYDTIQ